MLTFFTSLRRFCAPSRSRTKRQCGFTLVELLTTLAIISLLTGLLLPAVQYAREAARRTQCEHHLRQIGLAIQNYHDAHRSMPPGCLEWRPFMGSPHRKNFAWSAFILPQLEQKSVATAINFDVPFDHPANAPIAQTDLAIYQCPDAKPRKKLRGRSDYGGLYGQRITTRQNTDNGVFIFDHAHRYADILDGLSSTMAVAEDCLGPNAEWINGSNIFEQSTGVNDAKAWIGDNEIRSGHIDGALTVFCCGRTKFLSNSIDPKVLASYITRSDGDLANPEELGF